MQTTRTEAASPPTPLDPELLAGSKAAGIPYAAYAGLSPRGRGAAKAKRTRELQQEARRRGLDPTEFAAMTDDERSHARKQHPEKSPLKPKPRSIDAVIERHTELDPDELPPDEGPPVWAAGEGDAPEDESDEVDDEADVEMHGAAPAVPPTETRPELREKMTLGEVTPLEEPDLVGGKTKPRTLRDVYARWQIAEGAHLLRVERLEPKIYQGHHCAGYLGEVRTPISEEEFHGTFGGRKYELTVYGPDPKGRVDDNGEPIMKAKTEPFELIVPVLPPNFNALPLSKETPMNAAFAAPTTAADASIHKTNTDFTGKLLEQVIKPQPEPNGKALELLDRANERAVDATRSEAATREKLLSDRNRELSDELRESNKAIAALRDQMNDQRNNRRETGVNEAVAAVKNAQEPMAIELARSREQHAADLSRMKDTHQEEIRRLTDSYNQERAHQRERHEDELKRERARVSDFEQTYRLRADEIDRDAKRRETDLREQINAVRIEERTHAERRRDEESKAHAASLAALKDLHERELRINSVNMDSRIENSKTAHDASYKARESALELQIASLKEKVVTLKEQIGELEDQVKEVGDPVAVMDKAREQAEALGYVKEDAAAQGTLWENVAKTLASGLSDGLRTAPDWLPKAAGAFRAAQQQGTPPPGPQQRGIAPAAAGAPTPGIQAERPMGTPKRRTVSWGSQDETPVAPPYQVIREPVYHTPPAAPQAPAPQAAAPAAPAAPQAAPAPQPAQQSVAAPPVAGPMGLSPEVVMQFVLRVDEAINQGATPAQFAEMFVGNFPEYAARVAAETTAEQFLAHVGTLPGSEKSAIVRRAGTQWVTKMWDDLKRRTTPA